jgi:hypothetical protein
MNKYRSDISSFFAKKGMSAEVYDFEKADNTYERLPFYDMAPITAFYVIIEKYFGEKLLKEMYFELFHKHIYEPLTKEQWDEMKELKTKCIFFYKKGIPKHAKNYFESFFRKFVVIYLFEKKTLKKFCEMALIDPDSEQIVSEYLLN